MTYSNLQSQQPRSNARQGVCSSLVLSFIKLAIAMLFWAVQAGAAGTSITDNACVFRVQGKLFSLASLDRASTGQYYRINLDPQTSILFNFCDPFTPAECPGQAANREKGYSFLIEQAGDGSVYCVPYSSDSKAHYFTPQYSKEKGEIRLNLSLSTKPSDTTTQRTTDFILDCQQSEDPSLKSITAGPVRNQKLTIYGSTPRACPVFEISSIWRGISDNQLIFGTILFLVGFVMLFFGVLMTHLMIFIAAYFLSFAVLALIASSFLRPDSSTVVIYFALLLILFLSTLIAYALTRLVNVSIFFIGAFFGFILAAIVNSIFCKLFDIYSIYSLIAFQVVFTIPFGLLTFKFSEQIIILSTSLAGAYMMVRPFSWIIGGFPNEFTLYLMVENGDIKTLPWTFFIYILVIIAVAVVGALYQLLKIKRRNPKAQVETNFITSRVQVHVDKIKLAVQHMISLYAADQPQDEYKNLRQMEEIRKSGISIEEPAQTKEKKKKEENF